MNRNPGEETERERPLASRLVQRKPMTVDGRELVPLVKVTGRVRRRASLSKEHISARGHGFVHMRPVGVLERRREAEGGEVHHQIQDATGQAVRWLVLVAFLVPWLSALTVYVCGRSDEEGS